MVKAVQVFLASVALGALCLTTDTTEVAAAEVAAASVVSVVSAQRILAAVTLAGFTWTTTAIGADLISGVGALPQSF